MSAKFGCVALSPSECEPLPSELVDVVMIKHPNYVGGKKQVQLSVNYITTVGVSKFDSRVRI